MQLFSTPLDAITSLFWHSDHHESEQLEVVFADQVRLDDTALQGGDPMTEPSWTITATTMTRVWQTGDPGLIASALADSDDGIAEQNHIVRFREYFDPIVLQTAFGEDVAATFSLGGDR